MRESHVTSAEQMEAPEDRHGSADAVTALDAHETRQDSVPVGFLELLARRHEPHPRRVLRGQPPHHVDLLEGELDRVEKLRLARHVRRPELRAHVSSTEARQVGLPLRPEGRVLGQVVEWKITEVGVPTVLPKVPREVVVPQNKK